MTLVKCPFCEKQISDKAECCPHCKGNVKQIEIQEIQQEKVTELQNEQKKENKKNKTSVKILVVLVVVLLVSIVLILFLSNNKEVNENSTDDKVEYTNTTTDLPTELEYGFVDYTEFSEYWFDGIFRCGTDFEAGDYYILPLFGSGAIYEVCDSPDEFSWSYHRLLRKITVEAGQYVNVAHGGIMVRADEVDTNNWSKYGVFLVGEDILAGEYKIETINSEYKTDLYHVQGINGAYQINEQFVESEPIESNQLFDDSAYITLEDGQYITITNAKVTNVNVVESASTEQENEIKFSMDAKPIDEKEYEKDGFVYILYDDGSIEITQYIGKETELDIYSEINGYPVSRIGSSAFENCSALEEIQLWADVISIGESAFKGCTKLKEISIPSSVTEICAYTFEGCTNMKEADIWGDVVSIGENAFKGCVSLKEISIPSSCLMIDKSAFEGCTDLEEATLWGGNIIGECAFRDCTSLKEISIPSEVTEVKELAFEGCTNLKEVTVWGDNVTFGANAFANCPKLKEMPEGAYNDYSKLESNDESDTTVTSNANKITARECKSVTEKLLEDDLGKSVKVTKMYYNEELQGCYVEFKTNNNTDAAAVHFDTRTIDYKSEYNYYSERATELRKQTPINETELHKCNQAILSSSYSEWNFAIVVMENDGKTESNGWKKIK